MRATLRAKAYVACNQVTIFVGEHAFNDEYDLVAPDMPM
jgi:hypothetical protein